MNGDLSLSQSLGGLRIANPDDDEDDEPAVDVDVAAAAGASSSQPPSSQQQPTSSSSQQQSQQLRLPQQQQQQQQQQPEQPKSQQVFEPPAPPLHTASTSQPQPPVSSTIEDKRPTISSQSSGSTIRDLQRPLGLSQISSDNGSNSGSYHSYVEQGVGAYATPGASADSASISGANVMNTGAAAAASRGTSPGAAHRDGLLESYNPQNPQKPYRAPSVSSDHFYVQSRMSRQPYDTQSQYSQNSQYSSRMRDPNDPRTSARPLSIYNHGNASSSSQISHASYRYNNDNIQPPQPNMGLSRSASRATASAATAAMGGQMPTRQPSRSYRGDPQMPASSGMILPRRSSRRVAPSYNGTAAPPQGSPYAMEGGPLPSSEEWKDKGAAVATRQEIDANGRPVQKVIKKGVKDFNFGRTLGEGSYSTVLAATDRQTMREYAIKVLDKRHIIKEKKVKYVNIEKDALNRLTEHPGIVRLYYTFQDERSLYFVLDVANGGELLGVLKKMGTFDEDCARFYSAQILDSIAYMHSKGIIHRDLKPENVLLDDNMHTKITDFGTAKILDIKRTMDGGPGNDNVGDTMDGADQERANSFVGTAEYVSPELLTDKNACKASDLWAFGCIVYQLLTGRPPFKASNEYQTFQKIVALDYVFPEGFPPIARDLIERLLVLDPSQRIPIDHIMSHPFFDGIQWGKSLWKQKAPRLRSYMPPPSAPISLNNNGSTTNLGNIPGIAMAPAPSPSHSMHPQQQSVQSPPQQLSPPQTQPVRPQLRAITEVAPPSQLDLDWSSVLTRNNERILKLGNMNVLTAPAPHSPNTKPGGDGEQKETPNRKFSRFFGGSTTKKRERLVIITSSARLILAAAGGGEKKAKMEINLLIPGTSWKSYVDGRGLTVWSVDTRDKHLSFDDPRSTPSDPEGSVYSTQEWLEMIERAKEVAMSQSAAHSYSSESAYNDLASSVSSPASASGGDGVDGMQQQGGPSGFGGKEGRNTLRKDPGDTESLKGRKPRFSKRHSKSGLAAVF
ncbi:hypothetical protein AAFC00_004246 [Neodothiora populina]|uniref:non-specific serine/threonine protein kinase n=1 Tax=Neodothiora populina TaxID=2781224 RepID=A0ABR3PJ26_9PEZI